MSSTIVESASVANLYEEENEFIQDDAHSEKSVEIEEPTTRPQTASDIESEDGETVHPEESVKANEENGDDVPAEKPASDAELVEEPAIPPVSDEKLEKSNRFESDDEDVPAPSTRRKASSSKKERVDMESESSDLEPEPKPVKKSSSFKRDELSDSEQESVKRPQKKSENKASSNQSSKTKQRDDDSHSDSSSEDEPVTKSKSKPKKTIEDLDDELDDRETAENSRAVKKYSKTEEASSSSNKNASRKEDKPSSKKSSSETPSSEKSSSGKNSNGGLANKLKQVRAFAQRSSQTTNKKTSLNNDGSEELEKSKSSEHESDDGLSSSSDGTLSGSEEDVAETIRQQHEENLRGKMTVAKSLKKLTKTYSEQSLRELYVSVFKKYFITAHQTTDENGKCVIYLPNRYNCMTTVGIFRYSSELKVPKGTHVSVKQDKSKENDDGMIKFRCTKDTEVSCVSMKCEGSEDLWNFFSNRYNILNGIDDDENSGSDSEEEPIRFKGKK